MKIKQALNTYATNGSIFRYLPRYGTSTALQMSLAYVLRHSGLKTTSALVDEFTDENGHLTEDGQVTIGGIITTMFKDNWDRKWETLTAEYEPLENYNMVESGNEHAVLDYGTKTTNKNYGSQDGTSTKGRQADEREEQLKAFNSGSYQDSNKTSMIEGIREDSYTQGAHHDTEVVEANQDETDKEHELRRHGNIGVTTSQQMAQSELSLRSYRFFEEMFKDIDSLITLGIYEDIDRESGEAGGSLSFDINLTNVTDGVRIDIVKNGEVTQTAEVRNGKDGKDGITPDFKIEDGNLYVNP